MSRLCLDTSGYSQFKRGHPEAVERIDTAEWIGVPSIVLGELRTGFLLGTRQSRNEDELATFLDHAVVRRLDVDGAVAEICAEIVASLREAGTSLPTNDVWIAATAAASGASVLTYDEHFRKIARVGAVILERTAP